MPPEGESALLGDLLRAGTDLRALRSALERAAPGDADLRVVARRAPPPLIAVLASPPWIERPLVAGGLVMNPRTPRAVALRFVGQLFWRDLAEVAALPLLAPGLRGRAEQLLRDQCADLRLGDRTTLARLATPPVLRPLLADEDPRVVTAALENPRLTEGELTAALRGATSEVLPGATAACWRWRDSYPVALALAIQPRTPLGTALAAVARLLPLDLRRVAQDPGTPPFIRAEAVRRLTVQVPSDEGV